MLPGFTASEFTFPPATQWSPRGVSIDTWCPRATTVPQPWLRQPIGFQQCETCSKSHGYLKWAGLMAAKDGKDCMLPIKVLLTYSQPLTSYLAISG